MGLDETGSTSVGNRTANTIITSFLDYELATRQAEALLSRYQGRDDERELSRLIAAIDTWEQRRPKAFWVG